MANTPLTKKDLTEVLNRSNRELMDHMTKSLGHERTRAKEEFDKVHVGLEAIKEMLVYRRELRNLFRELKARDKTLDESKSSRVSRGSARLVVLSQMRSCAR